VDGYGDLLKILEEPEAEDHKSMRKWVGKKWDRSILTVKKLS
jgi:hypothetical protein